MGFLTDILGGDNPSDAAMPYLQQVPQVAEQNYSPYINAGNQAGNTLSTQYNRMLNPTDFMASIMKNYSMSPGAEYQKDQLTKSLNATAAAGGYAGNPFNQQQIGEMTHGLLSEDMQQYLKDALGIYSGGISGEQDIYNKGYGATSSLADMLAGNLNSEASSAFMGSQQQNLNAQAMLKMLGQALGMAAGGFSGGIKGASTMGKAMGNFG